MKSLSNMIISRNVCFLQNDSIIKLFVLLEKVVMEKYIQIVSNIFVPP